jgi:hypothetical protein
MYDNDVRLMVAIFQRLDGQDESDPAYVKMYDCEIKDAGEVLEYLGLAQPAKNSPLGWRPTHLLMEIIAKRLSKQKPQLEPADDELMVHLLRDAVFGDAEGERGFLGYKVLLELGLLQENDAGGWGATKELQKLFSDGYYRRYLHRSIERHRQAA